MYDLNRKVCEVVMGLVVTYNELQDDYGIDADDPEWPTAMTPVPDYSTNISDAWLVVERMLSFDTGGAGWEFYLHNDTAWCCGFIRPDAQGGEVDKIESAPLAICLAALKALA